MNHLLNYFDLPKEDTEIIRLIKLEPEPLIDLAKYEVQEGCTLIQKALKKTFLPTSQIVRLFRQIVGIGRAHVSTTYTDENAFRDTCYRKDVRPTSPWHATALIGLAGVGKTHLAEAISRFVTSNGATLAYDGMSAFPIELVWLLTMIRGTTLEAVLRPLVPDLRKDTDLLISVAKRAYSNIVGLIILDESQFITSTQEAHAKAAATLMKTTNLGPPALYCANYTMINKLTKRPQQERDRLLSNVLVLMPEARGSKDYGLLIDAQLKVFGSATSSDTAVTAGKHADQIHNYCFGIARKSAILLENAWAIARTDGCEIMQFSHVEKAYASEKFASHRKDVEILKQQAFEKLMKSEDLWCDFAPPMPSNVVSLSTFGEGDKQQIGAALSRATMTKDERAAFDALVGKQPSKTGKTGKVVKLPRADKSLAALQEAGAALMPDRD